MAQEQVAPTDSIIEWQAKQMKHIEALRDGVAKKREALAEARETQRAIRTKVCDDALAAQIAAYRLADEVRERAVDQAYEDYEMQIRVFIKGRDDAQQELIEAWNKYHDELAEKTRTLVPSG